MDFIKRLRDKLASRRINRMLFDKKTAAMQPIAISCDVEFDKLPRGSVIIDAPIERGMIRIGFDGSDVPTGSKDGKFSIRGNGRVTFKGKASFGEGIALRVSGTGNAVFGKNFRCGNYSCISCSNEMIFDDDVLTGWNIVIRDTDGHSVFDADGVQKESSRAVHIGRHVWICSFAHILRASVADDCVVAWGARVFKNCDEKNALIGGFPAKILQSGIRWEE